MEKFHRFRRSKRGHVKESPAVFPSPSSLPGLQSSPSSDVKRPTTAPPLTIPQALDDAVPPVPTAQGLSPLTEKKSIFRALKARTTGKRARSPATHALSPAPAVVAQDTAAELHPPSPEPSFPASQSIMDLSSPPVRGQRPEPKMPAFLELNYEDLIFKYSDLTWRERTRVASSMPASLTINNPNNNLSPSPWARPNPKSYPKPLDRYTNIHPWQHNRIHLRVPHGKPSYINASPIILPSPSTPGRADRYIAMQGPTQQSSPHVWRMIVEQLDSPAVIIMLTETHEANGMEKCWPYFPRNPEDPPIEVSDKYADDGFKATVRCAEIIPTIAGDAIELRRLVINVQSLGGLEGGAVKTQSRSGSVEPESGESPSAAPQIPEVDMGASATTPSTSGLKPNGNSNASGGSPRNSVSSSIASFPSSSASSLSSSSASAPASLHPRPSPSPVPSVSSAGSNTTSQQHRQQRSPPQQGDEREVFHFLYKRWPDFGVPDVSDLDSFFTLMRLSRQFNGPEFCDDGTENDNPRIVHCSAGVGRSGTFICLEHLMRELDAGYLDGYDEAWFAQTLENGSDTGMSGANSNRSSFILPEEEAFVAQVERALADGSLVPSQPPQNQQEVGVGGVGVPANNNLAVPAPQSRNLASALVAVASVSCPPPRSRNTPPDLIFETVDLLRRQRKAMVQSESQYMFLYRVLRMLWKEKYAVHETGEPSAKRLEVAGTGEGEREEEKSEDDMGDPE